MKIRTITLTIDSELTVDQQQTLSKNGCTIISATQISMPTYPDHAQCAWDELSESTGYDVVSATWSD